MKNNFVEFFKDKTKTVCVCLRNILYIEYRSADKSRVYLVDGTILDVCETYRSLCDKLLSVYTCD
ncbi:MAG: hypothetical protein IJ811_04625 [Clostridia bacterium]|nr:hypothetical protein [Clostridia bacterium]